MNYIKTSIFMLSIWMLGGGTLQASSTVAKHIKKGPSLITKTVRPILNTIHGITDDLRWIFCIFAIGEFVMSQGNYDIYKSVWLRLWLASLTIHYASKCIADELST